MRTNRHGRCFWRAALRFRHTPPGVPSGPTARLISPQTAAGRRRVRACIALELGRLRSASIDRTRPTIRNARTLAQRCRFAAAHAGNRCGFALVWRGWNRTARDLARDVRGVAKHGRAVWRACLSSGGCVAGLTRPDALQCLRYRRPGSLGWSSADNSENVPRLSRGPPSLYIGRGFAATYANRKAANYFADCVRNRLTYCIALLCFYPCATDS